MISLLLPVDPIRNETRRFPAAFMLVMILALAGFQALAGPAPAQTYFIPANEAQLRTTFLGAYSGTGRDVWSVLSISPGSSNTLIYYDHYENGYDADIANPASLYSATNKGGTQIWGDNIPANGMPPGFTSDLIIPGKVIVLTNSIPVPRAAGSIYYDGGDRIASTRGIAMTLISWPLDPGPVLADAIEIYDTSLYGTNFVAPVGINSCTSQPYPMFSYSALAIMPAQDGTVVEVDTNANGTIDLTVTLNKGESFLANSNGTIRAGAEIRASKPVQVHLFTGRRNSQYQSRWFTLDPRERWSTNYYAPVGTTTVGTPVGVVLFNPYTNTLSVSYKTKTTSAGVMNIAARSTSLLVLPDDSGASFTANRPFTGVNVIDVPTSAARNTGDDYDWGCTLLTESALTPSILVGYGAGSSDLSGNGSPVWVMALQPTTLFVDYDGNPATGPLIDGNKNHYDVRYAVTNYQSKRIFNPSGSNNQTGMRVYTTNGVKIVAAWGEDADTATTGNPYLDAGTTIFGLPDITGSKSAQLATDANGNEKCEPGDQILYAIRVNNEGGGDLNNVILVDPLPSNTAYVAGSTTCNGAPYSDNNNPAQTPYPFDESGIALPPMSAFSTMLFTFKVQLNHPFPETVTNILNTATALSPAGRVTMVAEMPVYHADLSLAKSASRSFVMTGSNFLYTLTVTNKGPHAVTNATVRDPLPTGITFVSGGASYIPASGIWTIGTLNPGATTSLQFTVRASVSGISTNTAEICTSSLADPNSTPSNGVPGENDYGSVVVTNGIPALTLIKTAGAAADGAVCYVRPGTNLSYAYQLVNRGDTHLSSITVTDNVLGAVGTVAGPLAPGATSILYATHVNLTNSIVNLGRASATPCFANGTPIPGLSSVSATDSAAVVVASPGIRLTKTAGDAPAGETLHILPNSPVVYSFEVVVTGDTALTNITVTDDKLGFIGAIPGPVSPGSVNRLQKTHASTADSVTNTAVAVGWPVNGLSEVTDQDQAYVKVVRPAVSMIVVAGDAPDGTTYCTLKGSGVPYRYRVTNTGDTSLTNVCVTDDILGHVGTLPGVLPPGESRFLDSSNSCVAGCITNLGTVTGRPCLADGTPLPAIPQVTDTDDAAVNVFLPALSLVKTAGSAPDGTVLVVLPGSNVVYTYRIINRSDTFLASIVVTDNVLGAVGTIPGPLAPGGTTSLYATHCNLSNSVVNIGMASAVPCFENGSPIPNLPSVTDLDPASVVVSRPSIQLTKTAGDASSGEILHVLPGGDVTYSFEVVITGDAALTNVTVTDDKLGLIGVLPGPLAPGSTNRLQKTHVSLTDSVTNIAEVTGWPVNGLPPVSDRQQAVVKVVRPGLSIVKTAGGIADGGTNYIRAGTDVTYAYRLSNTGDTHLVNIGVMDDKLGLIETLAGPLAPGESRVLTKNAAAIAESVINIGTVSGTPADDAGTPLRGIPPVSARDEAIVRVVGPAVSIVQLAGDAPDGTVYSTLRGSSVPYRYRVANIGDVCLTNVCIGDDKLGDVGVLPGVLHPGESICLCLTNPVVLQAVTNLGTVTGQPCLRTGAPLPNLAPVTDTDDAVVNVYLPGLELVKTAGPAADGDVLDVQPGDSVTYTFRLVNTGDAYLSSIAVTDNVLGVVGFIPGPVEPGWSTNLTATHPNVQADVVNVADAHAIVVFSDGSPIPEIGPISATDDARVQIACLMLRKEDTPDPVRPGQTLSYTIWVSNPSAHPVSGVAVTERYPALFKFESSVPAPASGQDTWLIGELAPGALFPIVISGTVSPAALSPAVLTNTVSVVSVNGGSYEAVETTRVLSTNRPDSSEIRVTKRDDADPVRPGSALTYTIRVENYGPSEALNVKVTEAYDPLFAWSVSDPAPEPGTSNVWTLGTMPANTVREIVVAGLVSTSAPDGYLLYDTVVATADNADPSADAEMTLVGLQPPTDIRKTASLNPVLGGQMLSYTITVANVSADAVVSNVSVVECYDPLFLYTSSEPAPMNGVSNVWFLGDLPPGYTTNIVILGMASEQARKADMLFNTVEAITQGGSRTAHLDTRVINAPPIPVTLVDFRAVTADDGVRLKWETATEFNNLGFNLYRAASATGKRIRVNARLVPGANDVDGQRYRVLDSTARPGQTYYYWLEEVAADYQTTLYGPAIRRGSDDVAPVAVQPPLGSFQTTTTGGLYRIRYETLAAAGLPVGGLDATKLGIRINGAEVPVFLDALAPAMKPGDSLLFYARASKTGMGCEVALVNKPVHMRVRNAGLKRTPGDVYLARAGDTQRVRFTTDPAMTRYFLMDFTDAPVWVLDITQPTNAVILTGYSYVGLTNGLTAVYLSYDPKTGPAKCLAVQDEAVIDVPCIHRNKTR